MLNHIMTIPTYTFLYLAVVLLWVPSFKKIPLWSIVLLISIVFGLLSQRIDYIGLVFILILACATLYLNNKKLPITVRVFSAIILFALGLGLGLAGVHLLPGFQNLRVLNNAHISSNGIPFSLYLNFDKTVVGIFILGILHQRITTKAEWCKMFKTMAPRALLVIFIVAILSFAFKFVWFDPKLSPSLPIWAMTNLFFVCLAEEGFFRGFIQKYLCLTWRRVSYGNTIAIILSAIFFGLSHFMGGPRYIILATIAGIGYGWIYWRTQRIEASILTHFSLNLIHFLFFTYPALANSVLH
ncbi:MAG: CPBP family intramembrane metalloprotease [Gammaproteobacteria bacterium]|nr:CPBP family intramembrane metalloprotease [Gammaproteobacteria bacterium]